MNFLGTLLPASLDNSLADIKILRVKNSMLLKILEILLEMIFMMLLAMSISISSQVTFCYGVQTDLFKLDMKPTSVNV